MENGLIGLSLIGTTGDFLFLTPAFRAQVFKCPGGAELEMQSKLEDQKDTQTPSQHSLPGSEGLCWTRKVSAREPRQDL